jgi:hypothetical protein
MRRTEGLTRTQCAAGALDWVRTALNPLALILKYLRRLVTAIGNFCGIRGMRALVCVEVNIRSEKLRLVGRGVTGQEPSEIGRA